MPEQVQSAPLHQGFPRIPHDFPDAFPVPFAVAMNSAMLTERFFSQRAFKATIDRVHQKIATIFATAVLLQVRQVFRQGAGGDHPPPVVIAAIDGSEQGQNLEIMTLFARQLVFFAALFGHRCNLAE